MSSGAWSEYRLDGSVGVVVSGQLHDVVLPNSFRVSLHSYPEREPPNAKAIVSIFGMTRDPDRRAVSPGPGQFVVNSAGTAGPPRPPALDRCGGIGWHFDLDAIDEPRLFRLDVTVPWGEGNSTGGLVLDPPLAWMGPVGSTFQTSAESAGAAYEISVTTVQEGNWRWSARAAGPSAPWLERFDLDLSTDGAGLVVPPQTLRIDYASRASGEALQSDLVATKS